ncbi:hypothetical protein BH23CHL7_BH23CHL7_01010 [soil metagenome]
MFILLGLVALVALAMMGALSFLNQRRMGTVLAVSSPRARPRSQTPARRGSSAHK